jgi:hypothetical protein
VFPNKINDTSDCNILYRSKSRQNLGQRTFLPSRQVQRMDSSDDQSHTFRPSLRMTATQPTCFIQAYDFTAWSSVDAGKRYVLVLHLIHNSPHCTLFSTGCTHSIPYNIPVTSLLIFFPTCALSSCKWSVT